MSRLLRTLPGALVAVLLAAGLPGPATAIGGHWTTTVFAEVPDPGFPAYVFVHRNGRVYAGTYQDPNGAGVPSRVFEWTAGGELLRSWAVPGQDLAAEHGVQVANQTRHG
ncbi:MAG: hypothetical protein QOD98_479, partial [Nocardioidaceae bacterium]|nr:hypothetical protein [Nocardioidaceae bacterium]